MTGDSNEQRRAHYRLRYPEAERPTAHLGGRELPVVELSESGARVVLSGLAVSAGGLFRGEIHFKDGEPAWVQGEWLRVDGDTAVMRFAVGVSLPRMIHEQRRLIRLYPEHFNAARSEE